MYKYMLWSTHVSLAKCVCSCYNDTIPSAATIMGSSKAYDDVHKHMEKNHPDYVVHEYGEHYY